jgi:3-phenylpropionate/trans-cinnamate dioxygenase alpha subunit
MLEQDDGENWAHSTRASQGTLTGARPAVISMGQGHDQVIADPSGQSHINTVVNEHGQRWTYRSWQEWLKADSWDSLMRNHSRVPEGKI